MAAVLAVASLREYAEGRLDKYAPPAASGVWARRSPPPDPIADLRGRLRIPWTEVLREEERHRGMSFYGSGGRVRRLGQRLLDGQPITVHMIGGSITAHGLYPSLLMSWINSSFPHAGHRLMNHAMPASTSSYMAPCFECLVTQEADLVVVEMTLNDRVVHSFDSPDRRAYEQLVRKALRLPSRPAVLLLHSYAWYYAFGDGATGGLFYPITEGHLTMLSQYYDVPALSVRTATWRLMQAGIQGFSTSRLLVPGHIAPATGREIPLAAPKMRPHYYFEDVVHPAKRGFMVLAELLVAALARGVEDAAFGRPLDPRPKPQLQDTRLPHMIPHSTDQRTTFCAMQRAFKPVVDRSEGFKYRPERPESTDFVGQKWAWSGRAPGDWAELVIDTRDLPPVAANSSSDGSSSGSNAAEPRLPAAEAVETQGGRSAQGGRGDGGGGGGSGGRGSGVVYLVRLRSYEGMGTARVECVSGCSCDPSTVVNSWAVATSVFEAFSFQATQHQRCRVRVTIVNTDGVAADQLQKVVLVAALVAHSCSYLAD
ncbi:hypothetical protein D9Q98_009159 [Chlorella vulgaris]|uniref:SGNH hydrolase-type esterase domain-containing protein n=1 Tax=Chlorella vulgaris TaxID=3077 RepID=A0A9D4TNY0_CHLVU|nr:hypothetical protein D9Q98_009159 [Chlorella vulgaris]